MAALDLRKHERREKWDLARGGGRVGKGHQVHVRRLRPSVGGIAENGHARPQPQIVIADLGVMDLAGISQCRRLVDGVEILQPADIARRTGGIRSREKGVLREAATVASVQDVEPARRWRCVAYLAMAGDECPPRRDGLCRRNWRPRTLDLEILLLPKRNFSIEVHRQATSSVLTPQSSPRASDPIVSSHAAADLTSSLPSPLQVMPPNEDRQEGKGHGRKGALGFPQCFLSWKQRKMERVNRRSNLNLDTISALKSHKISPPGVPLPLSLSRTQI